MRGGLLPIMLGVGDKANKCIAAGKDKKLGAYSLFICWLEEEQERGTTVDMENVNKIIAHLHFCKLETAQAFRDVVAEMVKQWECEVAMKKELGDNG